MRTHMDQCIYLISQPKIERDITVTRGAVEIVIVIHTGFYLAPFRLQRDQRIACMQGAN